MSHSPLVSVYLPYYNDMAFLKDSIESVLNQTYQNWELILLNHASTDGSRDFAHSYKDKRIIHIDAEKNLGAGSGNNIKISLPHMKGKYIKLLCADDKMKPDCLENLVDCLENNPGKDICFSNMDYIDEKGAYLNITWYDDIPMADCVSDEKQTLLKFFHGYSHIAYPATLIKVDAIKSINLDTTLIMLFDVSLWIKLLINGAKIMFLPNSTIDYRIHNNQMSGKANLKKAFKVGHLELYQILSLYYNIKDVDLIKYLCPCAYSEMLSKEDVRFIPFIVSYYFASIYKNGYSKLFKDQTEVREIFGTTRLYYLMQDDKIYAQIQNKFGFGIKEFRSIYTWMSDEVEKQSVLSRIGEKPARRLSLLQIVVLLVSKLFYLPKKLHKILCMRKTEQNISNSQQKYTV